VGDRLRIIHQLARSGGTVVNRCLGCMPGVMLLSEIHPRSANRPDQFHALVQAHHWFGLLTEADRLMLEQRRAAHWHDWEFADSIALIQQRTSERNARLVIREYSNADFILTPRNSPVYRSRLEEQLRGRLPVLRTALVRHPLEQWRSIQDYRWSKDRMTLEDFLYGYRRFAEMIAEVGFVHYEDFCRDPDSVLQDLCRRLDVPYDNTYRQRLAEYSSITGDEGRKPGAGIRATSRPPPDAALLARVQSCEDYHQAIQLLGYT